MGILTDQLNADIRIQEGLKACINCGTCTAICPAAEFYNYDPRQIAVEVQKNDDTVLEELLKSETIWYCGECMSCKTRCPRGNTPGLIIMALRALSVKTGYFTESEKGRQLLAIKRTVGRWILDKGYCLYREEITNDNHPEQGPGWKWQNENLSEVMQRMGIQYKENGPGVMRTIPQDALDELKAIFDVTGGTEQFEHIEKLSQQTAKKMGIAFDNSLSCDYIKRITTDNNGTHTN